MNDFGMISGGVLESLFGKPKRDRIDEQMIAVFGTFLEAFVYRSKLDFKRFLNCFLELFRARFLKPRFLGF